MSTPVLMNLWNKFKKTRAQMLYSIYHNYDIKITLKSHFGWENVKICHVLDIAIAIMTYD